MAEVKTKQILAINLRDDGLVQIEVQKDFKDGFGKEILEAILRQMLAGDCCNSEAEAKEKQKEAMKEMEEELEKRKKKELDA